MILEDRKAKARDTNEFADLLSKWRQLRNLTIIDIVQNMYDGSNTTAFELT